jgi:uncharacterized protein
MIKRGFKMKQNQTLGFALLGLFIGLGLLGAGYFAAQSFVQVKLANQTLSVKGYAEKHVTSDYATWFARVRVTNPTEKGALRQTKGALQKLTAYIAQKGFDLNQISIQPYSIKPRYKINDKGNSTNEIDDFVADVSISLESEEVGKITALATSASDLIEEGVSFDYTDVNYLYRNIDALKISLLGEAARDAKGRAMELAKSVDSKVGSLRQARQGIFQITAKNDQSVSDYGVFDTRSIDKTVRAVVTMSFAIQ